MDYKLSKYLNGKILGDILKYFYTSIRELSAKYILPVC